VIASEGSSDVRILVIDDTTAIHNDFGKILAESSLPAIPDMSRQFLGEPEIPIELSRFLVDSAYQGEEEPWPESSVDGFDPPGSEIPWLRTGTRSGDQHGRGRRPAISRHAVLR